MAGKMIGHSYTITVVGENVDGDAIQAAICAAVDAVKGPDDFSACAEGPKKAYSEQGFKVFRAKVAKITVAQAGDAHVSKLSVRDQAEADAATA